MHVDSPDDSWKDDHRPGANARRTDHHLSLAKAANSPTAKAGVLAAVDPPDQRPASISPARPAPRLELSLTQILGSTGAAVTAAFLGSRLCVAGTLIGAALASVISVVGGALYTTSLKATRQQVAKVLVGRTDEGGGAPGTRLGLPSVPPAPTVIAQPAAPGAARRGSDTRRPSRPVLRGAVAGALLSAVVFAGALLVVTGVESVTGSALSGGSAGGLTILGGDDIDRGAGTSTPSTPASSTTGSSPTTGSPGTAGSRTTGSTTARSTTATTPGTTGSTTSAGSTTSEPGGPTASPSTGPSTTGSPAPTSPETVTAATTPTAATTTAPATTAPDAAGPGAAGPGAAAPGNGSTGSSASRSADGASSSSPATVPAGGMPDGDAGNP